jgi:dCTP deaminase
MSGLLIDRRIREYAEMGMISPFEPGQVRRRDLPTEPFHKAAPDEKTCLRCGESISQRPKAEACRPTEKIISYGVSSVGYDLRVKDEFRVFVNRGVVGGIVDPKAFDPHLFLTESGKGKVIIPPNSFALAASVERFVMPRNVAGIVLGKSTYARCGINVNCTPMEPGWEGHLTLELANTTPLPALVYADEGIAQVLFFETAVPCEVSYADRKGKYQGQSAEPTSARI